ncbi:MAG: hypothetical protein ACK40G_17030 [Cytophagaceae bacterium]
MIHKGYSFVAVAKAQFTLVNNKIGLHSLSTRAKLIYTFAILVFVSLMATVIWLLNGKFKTGIDDANIYFVYMRNLSKGYGLVYNVGGERVEGFTSLLWTLIGATFYVFTDNPEFLFVLLNIALITYTLCNLVFYFSSHLNAKRPNRYVILFLGLLAVVPGYFEWTVLSLLETGLWSSILILSVLNILSYNTENFNRSNISLSVLIFLLLLCRPESILWGLFFSIVRMTQSFLFFKKPSKINFLPIVTFLIVISAVIGFRLMYFGYPVPNTFYAKVSSDYIENIKNGIKYLYLYFIDSPVVILIISAIAYTLYTFFRNGKINFQLLFIALVILLTFSIPLYTGGDHFGYSRFIQPLVPIIYLALVLILLDQDIQPNLYIIVTFLLFLVFTSENSLVKYYKPERKLLWNEWEIARMGQEKSEKLNSFFDALPRLPSQGVFTAGGTAYKYNGVTIDLLGLNNVKMAHAETQKDNSLKNHAAFNKEIFMEQKPDLFWYAGEFVSTAGLDANEAIVTSPWLRKVFKQIQDDEKFNKEYCPVLIFKKNETLALKIFASYSFLNSLDDRYFQYSKIPVK